MSAEDVRVMDDQKDFVLQTCRDRDIKFIRLWFTDILGSLKSFAITVEELEQAREALAQSQKLTALGELTGGIAHDFNNLMTVIAGASDFLLKNRAMPEEKKLSYLKAIVETTERATALTSQLLAFGRRQAIKPAVIDLMEQALANVALQACRAVISRRRATERVGNR